MIKRGEMSKKCDHPQHKIIISYKKKKLKIQNMNIELIEQETPMQDSIFWLSTTFTDYTLKSEITYKNMKINPEISIHLSRGTEKS